MERQIEFSSGGAVKSGVLHVVHDSDDGAPGILESGTNAVADGVFAGPEGTRHGLVDDDNIRGAFRVAVIKKTAGNQTYAHGCEIVFADHLVVIHILYGTAWFGHQSFDISVIHIRRACRRQTIGDGGGFDTGDLVQALFEASPEAVNLLRF